MVLTLENTSDSQTRWERADGSVRGAWLPPNSLLLVKAEGATHGVRRSGAGTGSSRSSSSPRRP